MAHQPFNIMIVGQSGRLQYEAVLFAASLRRFARIFRGACLLQPPNPARTGTKIPAFATSLFYKR